MLFDIFLVIIMPAIFIFLYFNIEKIHYSMQKRPIDKKIVVNLIISIIFISQII